MAIKKDITLKIEGDDVPAEKLISAIRDFFALLEEVGYEVCDHRRVKWTARLKQGSSQVIFSGQKGEKAPLEKVPVAIIQGLSSLEKNPTKKPEYFNTKALRHVQDLGRIFPKGPASGGVINILAEGQRLKISDAVSRVTEKFLGAEHEELGEVEGRLEVISGHHGFSYKIYDALNDRAVECESPPGREDAIKEIVIRAFEKRVSAHGVVRFNPAGHPVHIIVQELKVFKDEKDLPSVEDIQRLFAR